MSDKSAAAESPPPGSEDLGALRRGAFLLYDGECPVCSRYVLWTNIREEHPGIMLLNAREHPGLVAALRAEGIEINDTMLLHVEGRDFVGAAAMAKLGEYTPRATPRQRIARWLGRSPLLSDRGYAGLVAGRKLLLRLLGREQIR
ncbi:MAG TPA: DCC1-like thiol-disulfide oxidoreductase family protein [Thermohalobaculum sp.]|nr:DCC1-like thiol-disulfide oxidoreductase family protein [Thermohalobaculum sp.]